MTDSIFAASKRLMSEACGKGKLFLSGLVLLLAAGSVAAEQGPLTGIQIRSENILFLGNKSFTADELKAVFRSAGTVTAQVRPQEMDTYSADRIAHGLNMLLAFYHNRGYLKASISPPEFDFAAGGTGSKVKATFKITENQRYSAGQVKVSGATLFSEPLLLTLLNAKSGRPLNLAGLNAGALAVQQAYLALGFLDVDVKPSVDAPDNKRTANVFLNIVEGKQYHVRKVELTGNSPISLSLVQESLSLQPGDVFGEKAFETCLQNLNELGITPVLTDRNVTFKYDREKALVDLTIDLEGKPSRQ